MSLFKSRQPTRTAGLFPPYGLVYGDYALSYGCICRFTDDAERFEYNFIRNLLWGMIPSVEAGTIDQLAAAEEHIQVVKRGVQFYKENKELLFYGRLLELPEYACSANHTVSWTAKDEQQRLHSYTKTGPSIYAALWESANDEKYLLAYNYSRDPQTMAYSGKQYTLEGKAFLKAKLS